MHFDKQKQKGFTVLYAVLMGSLLLMIGLAIFNITFRELQLSSQIKDSQVAFYAADAATECALFWDISYDTDGSYDPGKIRGVGPFGGFKAVNTLGDPVGYWKLNETSGTQAVDSSGNGNDGTLTDETGLVWIGGKIGNGIDVDGTDVAPHYIDVPDNDVLDPTTDISISVWIKPSTYELGNFVSKGANPGYRVRINDGGPGGPAGTVTFFNDPSGIGSLVRSNFVAPLGIWTHVVAIGDSDALNGELKLYINGTLDVGNSGPPYTSPNTLGSLKIGSEPGFVPDETFDGIIDEVRVYNRVLSDAEIKALAQASDFIDPIGAGADTVMCAGVDINDSNTGWDNTKWAVTDNGTSWTTVFDISFDEGRCALVEVIKDLTDSSTVIESRGYNTCDLDNPRRVERGLRVTY